MPPPRPIAAPVCPEHLLFLLNLLNTSAALLCPCAIILHTRAELLPGCALTMATCVLWLKLVSYAHVNYDYRCAEVAPVGVSTCPLANVASCSHVPSCPALMLLG